MSKIDLMQGDCLELMKNIPDGSVDMILCDLPYGTTACKWDIVISFDKLWERYKKICREDGAIVLFGSEPFSSKLRMSNLKMYKYDWIWNKHSAGNFLLGRTQPLKVCETISVFSKKTHRYFPILKNTNVNRAKDKAIKQKTDFLSGLKSGLFQVSEKNKKGTERYPINLIDIAKQANECNNAYTIHPTQKPVELLEYLIRTYSNEGDTILDNCMGSGSTGVACVHTNRNFIGIEKEPTYFRMARDRIECHQQEMLKPRIEQATLL